MGKNEFSISNIRENIFRIIDRHFISFEELLVSGSYANDNAKENSDIDIFALSKYVNNISIENIIYDGKCYQFIIFPFYKFYWLECFLQKGNCIYHSIIRKGIIIKSSSFNILKKYKISLSKVNFGLNSHAHLFLRYRLTELLDDIETTNTKEENIFIGIELINIITKIITNAYEDKGKHLARQLVLFSSANVNITNGLKELIENHNISNLAQFAEQILEIQGGRVKNYSTNYATLSATLYSSLLIQLPNHNIYQNNVLKVISDLYQMIPSKYLAHTFYMGNNQFLERGIYIHIYFTEELNASLLIDRMNKFFNSNIDRLYKENIRISFPYQIGFTPDFLFGGKSVFSLLLPYFKRLSVMVLTRKQKGCYKNKSDLVIGVFSALSILVTLIYEDDSNLGKFLFRQLEFYRTESIDPNNCLNNSQLKLMSDAIIRYNKELYCKQYSTISKIKNYYFSPISTDGKININVQDEISKWSIDFAHCINSIPDSSIIHSDILFPDTSPKEALYNSIIDHVFNIFFIEPHEKYSIIFYLNNILKQRK